MPNPTGGSGVKHLLRRASWSLVDQGLSAASNLLLSIIVARQLDAGGFGAFAIAFLTFGLVIAVARATIGQPLQISYSGAPMDQWREATRSALAAAVVLGTVVGASLVVIGLLLGGGTGQALVAVGVCMPGLVAQDICRMAFFSSGQAKQAALNDALWTALEFAALAAMIALGVREVGPFILAWGGSATVAAVVGCLVLGLAPRFRGCLRWLFAQRSLTGYLLAENILGEGVAQVAILFVGVAGSPADVGSLRAGQVLLGPLNVLVTAIAVFGIPEIARRGDMPLRQRQRFCWALSGAVTVVSIGYACVVLLLPDALGRQLFGDTWDGAQTVLLAMCALYLAGAIGLGPGVTLFGMGRARASFGLNLVKAPLLLLTLSLGIWQAGAVGAAWALALTETLMLPLLIITAVRAMRSAPSAVSGGDNPLTGLVGTPVTESVSVSATLLEEDRTDEGTHPEPRAGGE
ncbi:hypothetical protein GCM10009616_07450 [Microlunatus lacustris]